MSQQDPEKAAKKGIDLGAGIVKTILSALSVGTRSIFNIMVGKKESSDPDDPSSMNQGLSESDVDTNTQDDLKEEDTIDPPNKTATRNEHDPPPPHPVLFQKPKHDAEEEKEVKALINSIKHIIEAPEDASKPSIKPSGPSKPSPPRHS